MNTIDMNDSTQRFSDRVENYVRYRPSYPPMIRNLILDKTGLSREWSLADLGSGTGKLTEVLIPMGCRIYAVEPNREMRAAAESLMGTHPNFVSIEGTAEQTGLVSSSVDMIVAGQAFHWFEPAKTRMESLRILRNLRWVCLIWNRRRIDSSDFQIEYEQMLQTHGTDYKEVRHQNVDDSAISAYFGNKSWEKLRLPYEQHFNFDELKGRLLSSSYAPQEGHIGHKPMMDALFELYEKYQRHDKITFDYDTELYLGRIQQS